jgi:D-glycero-D-manno-heptose 1,7-bisphosphate phosphatase
MKRPAVFFDRDNTLIVSDGYLGDPSKVELVEGAAEAVARARQLGFVVVTVSNQSGVARGMFDEEAVRAVNHRMDELLRQSRPAAVIARHEFCPDHPQGVVERYRKESDRRKPRPGMIWDAAEKLNLDLSRSWLIGDAPRDIEAGRAAGCRTILLKDGTLAASPAALEESAVQPDFTAGSLGEAISIVSREVFGKVAPGTARGPLVAAIAGKASGPMQEDKANDRESGPGDDAAGNLAPSSSGHEGSAHESPAHREGPGREHGPANRSERLLEQILLELRRHRETPPSDFSVPKLLAGVVQVLALGLLFLAYLNREHPDMQHYLLYAIMFQVLTVALLIMGRQR